MKVNATYLYSVYVSSVIIFNILVISHFNININKLKACLKFANKKFIQRMHDLHLPNQFN